MPRAASGTLQLKDGRYQVRVTLKLPDGSTSRPWVDLETDDPRLANLRKARAVRNAQNGKTSIEELEAEAVRTETFSEAMERILEKMQRNGMVDVEARRKRLVTWAVPKIGVLAIDKVRTAHVDEILESCRDSGKSKQTVLHLKHDLSSVWKQLWREEAVKDGDVIRRAAVPKNCTSDDRERTVLTDDELAVYLGFEHPNPKYRMPVLERQTMACVARMLGGLRTGDLHSARWELFERDDSSGRFVTARIKHAKTGKRLVLIVPEMLRPILRDWWERSGRPADGVIFPKRRARRLGEDTRGEIRQKSSHAAAFRRDLRRAFGIERWNEETQGWETTRELTDRERQLLEPTQETKPVDFHSWRRAFAQALADADTNAQTAMALTGHSTMAAHVRYLRNSVKARTIPAAALPRIGVERIVPNRDESSEEEDPERPKTPSESNTWAGSSAVERWPYNREKTYDFANLRQALPVLRTVESAGDQGGSNGVEDDSSGRFAFKSLDDLGVLKSLRVAITELNADRVDALLVELERRLKSPS